ncbi:MAG: hypothetical protein CVV49_06665 [Spirochaetae bacterium HGW-Spirochaetae-5]|nr:MAG: hypothetical protein CVV49_06665 [Spirochaetae bacterium HGW-Spirochaetae-5]
MLFDNLGILNWIFLISAVLGGSLFIARIILMLFGMGDGADTPDAGHDFHPDMDTGVHHGESGHSDNSDSSFKILSLQGIMGFFLMFGAVGFTMNRIALSGAFFSVTAAVTTGFITMWLTAKLLKVLLSLQSDGTVEIYNAIGKEGTVYQRILPGSTGKVQIVVQNRLVEYEAMSRKGDELPTGTPVMATYYKGNILIVEKI